MIKKYIEENKMKAHFIEENLFDIESVGRFLFLPKRDVMISSDYELNIERSEKNTECDFFVYSFGGRLYYTLKSSWKSPELNLFRHLGKSTDEESTLALLGVRGSYERLNGNSSYEDWVKRANFLGCRYLGICEKNSLSGAIKFQSACKSGGIKSIIGATYSVLRENSNVKYDVKCFVKNTQGWSDILKINHHVRVLTKGYIKEADFFKLKSNLTVILDPKKIKYEDTFPLDLDEDFYYQLDAVEYSKNDDDKEYLENLQKFIRGGKFKPIIAYDAYYLDKDDAYIKETLNSISNSSKDDKGSITSVNEKLAVNQYFKSIVDFYDELSSLFNIDDDSFDELWDDAYNNMVDACRVKFEIDTSHRYLPKYKMTEEEKSLYEDNWDLFYTLIEKGFEEKVPKEKYDEYQDRLEKEIDVIDYGDVMDYFLILWDIVRWCESNNMLLGFGRGSAAGALIAYLLNITKVDPIEHGLLFERFLNPGRVKTSLPDIDSDFSSEDRPKVKKYIIEKYGDTHTCSVGTYGNLRIKSAIKYFSKLYGCNDNNYLNSLTKFVFDLPSGSTVEDMMSIAVKTERGRQFVKDYPEVIQDMILSINQPISEGVHAGAVIIVPDGKNIWDHFPVKRMTLKDGTEMFASEYEGGEMENIGYLKLDILGLSELDKLRFMLNMIKEHTGEEIDIYKIPFTNKDVFKYFQNGWNQDVFQFGTPLFVKYLRQLGPENIDDLIAAVALGRPGPMENNFHNEYIMRKNGEKEVEYMWGCEEITKNTYGILCYQEQIMLICQQIGGFSLVEADSIRKALGKKLMDLLESYKVKFFDGAKEKGCPEDSAIEIWEAMVEFAKYSFNKCISGKERFFKVGHNGRYEGFRPTIEEMYKIKNDVEYARSVDKYLLHQKYKHRGYGVGFSLNRDGKLRRNKIVDIRYEGKRPVYRITLVDGKTITATKNHKFPTQNGEKILEDLNINEDMLFVNIGHIKKDTCYRFTNKRGGNNSYHSDDYVENYRLNSEPGKMGFQKKDTQYTRFLSFEKHDSCQNDECEKKSVRLEIHHIDGNHGNNDHNNLTTLCASCHKKEHYRMGRTTMGSRGLHTEMVYIKSIEYLEDEDVYDVEMDSPSHTFAIENGIITCNSHAVCYAKLGYVTQWMKVNYPIYFWAAAFENLPSGKKGETLLPKYISEVNKTGSIKILPPDINKSRDNIYIDIDKNIIYWTLTSIKNVGDAGSDQILELRADKKYFSFGEFLQDNVKTGSKVTKRVIERLVLGGVFDEFEEIQKPCDRMKLITQYREDYDVKIKAKDEEKDVFLSNQNKTHLDWWWQYQQKVFSGYSEINYKSLAYLNGKEIEGDYPYVSHDDFMEEDNISENVTVAGYVYDFVIRDTRRGKMASIMLDINYDFIKVTIWNQQYEKLKTLIDECHKKIVVINGVIRFDSYIGENALYSDEKTSVQILD